MSDVMIQADSLSKEFGAVRALDNVSFEVHKGEVVGFLGPNGAGKSTTMRIMTCFISPTKGSASVHGFDVFSEPLEVRKRIGYLPQRAPLYTDMAVWDYLEFAAQVRQLDANTFKKSLKKVVEVCGLNRVLGTPIGNLSHGYRQRVGLGQALIHDPPILILDEPTADLDPNEKAELLKYIKEIGKDRTILLSTHNLSEVEETCTRAIIVSKGKVAADGDLTSIRSRSGSGTVCYHVVIDGAEGAKNPNASEAAAALEKLSGARQVATKAQDGSAHVFEVVGGSDSDLRASIFRLNVDKGWTLLELTRDVQSLDSVFHELTKADEQKDRGTGWKSETSAKPASGASASSASASDAPKSDSKEQG